MDQVTILTSPGCNYCHAAKNLLQQQDISYREVDLLKDRERAQQLLFQRGQRTVPQIFINDEPVGGFTELSKLVREGNFNFNYIKSLN